MRHAILTMLVALVSASGATAQSGGAFHDGPAIWLNSITYTATGVGTNSKTFVDTVAAFDSWLIGQTTPDTYTIWGTFYLPPEVFPSDMYVLVKQTGYPEPFEREILWQNCSPSPLGTGYWDFFITAGTIMGPVTTAEGQLDFGYSTGAWSALYSVFYLN